MEITFNRIPRVNFIFFSLCHFAIPTEKDRSYLFEEPHLLTAGQRDAHKVNQLKHVRLMV